MMLNRIDNSTYLPTKFKQPFSPIMEALKSFKDINITDKSLKKCYRCKEMKDREEEFHHGASMCKDCRKEYDMERNSGGNKELIMSMRKAILELGEQVEKLTQRVDELERNNVATTGKEKEEQKIAKKISKVELVENGPVEESSEEDEPAEESSEEDEPEVEKKTKKVKSSKSDEKQEAKKGRGKIPKEEESLEEKPKKKVKSEEKTKKKVKSEEKTKKKHSNK
jgi:hypothetical protein